VTAAVTPVSYPFAPMIAASKQLPYGVLLGSRSFYSVEKDRAVCGKMIQ